MEQTEIRPFTTKQGKATLVKAISLDQFNAANGVEHVNFFFQYKKEEKGESANSSLMELMQQGVSNQIYSVILDLTNFSEKEKDVLKNAVTNHEEIQATTIVASCVELSGSSVLNNGIRNYTTLSASYLGMLDSDEQNAAFVSLKNRVTRQINGGDLYLGEVGELKAETPAKETITAF